MIIDTHCHYNLEPLSNDVEKYWTEAQKNGIENTIIVGTHAQNSQLALKIASKFSGMYASVGFHPGNYTEAIKELLDGDKYSQEKIDKLTNDEFLAIKNLLETEQKAKSFEEKLSTYEKGDAEQIKGLLKKTEQEELRLQTELKKLELQLQTDKKIKNLKPLKQKIEERL